MRADGRADRAPPGSRQPLARSSASARSPRAFPSGAVAAGRRICVHGDYDADGICATVLAILVLRELGAAVEWHLPNRFDEGYGVSSATLERLVGEGCGLVVTVYCGI